MAWLEVVAVWGEVTEEDCEKREKGVWAVVQDERIAGLRTSGHSRCWGASSDT